MDSDERVWHERALRDAVLAGDEAAWRNLHDRHFDSLYSYICLRAGRFRAGRRADWTEDAVQECWLTAVRRIGTFDPARGAFEGWLRGIADNVLRNQLRRASRRGRVERQSLSDGRAVEDAEARPVPGQGGELSEQIALVLSGLPQGYQDVLKAKYEDDRPVAEIAASWGKTPKTIESLLTRARAAFREAYGRLKEEC